MRLGIIILYVRDLAAAVAFYTEVVGFQVVPDMSDDHFIALTSDGTAFLGLEDATYLPPDRTLQPGSFELGIEVLDLETTHQAWAAAGVHALSAIEPMPGGRAFLARDPDGYVLSVYRFNP
jgi:predicted enzyme related to lactoylglutathione lyase